MLNQASNSREDTGRLLAAFAGIAHGGLILTIGKVAVNYKDFILSGMSPLTRLVMNLDTGTPKLEQEAAFDSDLRVALHRQNPKEFLIDVSRHTLNLAILEDGEKVGELLELIHKMLVDGGCVIVFSSSDSKHKSLYSERSEFHHVDWGQCQLLVKKTEQNMQTRRGGRRGRLAKFS